MKDAPASTTNVSVTENTDENPGATGSGAGVAASSSGTHIAIGGTVGAAPMSASVTYNGTSYSPRSVTIAKGGTVTWTNSSSQSMWIAADLHPSHTEYSGTSRSAHCPDTSGTAFDQCSGGQSFTFKFDRTGTWDYHDHLNASSGGSVVVQ